MSSSKQKRQKLKLTRADRKAESQVHDLHFGAAHGTFFTPANPLTLEARFGARPPKKKKPHV
jgi:hypothetical protein